jgi:hypothetical protein
VVVESPRRCVERIADGDVHVLVRAVAAGLVIDHDLTAWNHHVDGHAEDLALVMMLVGRSMVTWQLVIRW